MGKQGDSETAKQVGRQLERLDYRVVAFMRRWGMIALRMSLAVIFIWFGVLKPLGLSPAEPLIVATVGWLPLLAPQQWVAVIGLWEVAIGATFLFKKTVRIAIFLLAMQMIGTLMPLVMLPQVTFQAEMAPLVPTVEGQYIIKNLVIIAAAIAVGGTVRQPSAVTPRT